MSPRATDGPPSRHGAAPSLSRRRRRRSSLGPASPTMRPMIGVVWHYWIGVVLALGALATVGGLAANYFRKVESTRYPKGQ